MSARVIYLADYRRAKSKKTHAPKCGACRQPGHYAPSCPDDEARERHEAKAHAAWVARCEAHLANMKGGRNG